jgi:hypothetical protein
MNLLLRGASRQPPQHARPASPGHTPAQTVRAAAVCTIVRTRMCNVARDLAQPRPRLEPELESEMGATYKNERMGVTRKNTHFQESSQ